MVEVRVVKPIYRSKSKFNFVCILSLVVSNSLDLELIKWIRLYRKWLNSWFGHIRSLFDITFGDWNHGRNWIESDVNFISRCSAKNFDRNTQSKQKKVFSPKILNVDLLIYKLLFIFIFQTKGGIEYLLITPDRCLIFPSVDYVRNLVTKHGMKKGIPVVIDCSHIYGADFTAAKVKISTSYLVYCSSFFLHWWNFPGNWSIDSRFFQSRTATFIL